MHRWTTRWLCRRKGDRVDLVGPVVQGVVRLIEVREGLVKVVRLVGRADPDQAAEEASDRHPNR